VQVDSTVLAATDAQVPPNDVAVVGTEGLVGLDLNVSRHDWPDKARTRARAKAE
jgi:hypothetical protein